MSVLSMSVRRVETLERVKEVLEHLSLYIGLAIYTALGAKVDRLCLKDTKCFRLV